MEPARHIEHPYRVRFDEADAAGRLRPSGLLRYAQDMAWRHSEEAGFDREWYLQRSMNWLVRNVMVKVEAPITYGDVLMVSTEVTGWRQVWARRRSDIVRVASSAGPCEPLRAATVQTDWVLLTHEGRPARVPPEISAYFSPDQQFVRDRVVLPEPAERVSTLSTRVRPLDVDPMQHMNNAAYVDMIDDGISRLPDRQRPVSRDCYRISYVLPALPGTPIEIRCWAVSERQVACRISDGAGVELTKALVSRSSE